MLYGAGKKSPQKRFTVLDSLFIVSVIVVIIYFVKKYPTLADQIGSPPAMLDVVFGWILIIMSLELARRTVGKVIPFIGIALILYAYWGPYFPLGLGHKGYTIASIGESLFLGRGYLGFDL